MNILTLNAGSSSIKFALCESDSERIFFSGTLTGIATGSAALSLTTDTTTESPVTAPDFTSAIALVFQAIADVAADADIDAIAHRIVYGAGFQNHLRIDAASLARLRESVEYDPDHLPQALALIDACATLDADMPQIACFDTVFHHTMPTAAQLMPLPRSLIDAGARRHGFHGLSYEFLAQRLAAVAPEIAHGRVVIAHLGSGASLAALNDLKSVDTSMGFSPAGGIPMGNRSGDIDPALLIFMADQGHGIEETDDILTTQSGLLGVSGTTPHMHTLLELEPHDSRAADAVALFVHSVRKQIGAYAAVLDGLDALVFSGGIGENSAPIRARVCAHLSHLGIHLDTERNIHNNERISSDGALPVFVLPTNEQLMMTRIARELLK